MLHSRRGDPRRRDVVRRRLGLLHLLLARSNHSQIPGPAERPGQPHPLLARLVEFGQYGSTTTTSCRVSSGCRGRYDQLFPAHYEDRAWRLSLFGDDIDAIHEIDPLTGEKTAGAGNRVKLYANSHYVTPRPTLLQAMSR